MINRRKFLRNTGAIAAGSMLLPTWACDNNTSEKAAQTDVVEEVIKQQSVGVQLYTLRSKFPDGFASQMQELAKIGYTELESFAMGAHYCGLPMNEYKAITTDLGLKTISSHIRTGWKDPKKKASKIELADRKKLLMGSMTENIKGLIGGALEMGQEYLTLAYMEEFEYSNTEDWGKIATLCSEVAQQCKAEGIQFCYHNHAFEFLTKNDEGISLYDYLLESTEPEEVKMELDLYWVAKAEVDPIALFNNNPGRFPLWHVKDMSNTPEQIFTEVGNGVIDFTNIFEAAEIAGLKHFFVEQDQTPGEPIESLRTSYQNLSQILPGVS